MSKPMLRKGPRVAFILDLNLQWLCPEVFFNFKEGLGGFHLGWFSCLIGLGCARDTLFDVIDRGLLSIKFDEKG